MNGANARLEPHAAAGGTAMPDHSALWVVPESDERLRRDIDHQLFVKARFHREFLGLLRQTGARRVLEVGAGSTIDSCWLAARHPAEYHTIDSTRSSVVLARRVARTFPHAPQLHIGDAFQAPFPDGAFDLVFHQGLLEHFEDPRPLLRENLRLLRVGGVLVVDVPQLYSLYTVLKRRKMRRGAWPWGWEREYTTPQMRRLAEGLPMELVRISSWGYDFYTSILRWPWDKMQRRNPWARTRPFVALEALWRHGLEPLWEAPWRAAEAGFGSRFMMNVTGIFRRS